MASADFETEGVWRIPGGRLVTVWAALPEYIPTDTDVPFKWGPNYNMGQHHEVRERFLTENKVVGLFEIVEVFREPWNDADGSFKGRTLLVAKFQCLNDAIMFKMRL
jgi:hypothetical protein